MRLQTSQRRRSRLALFVYSTIAGCRGNMRRLSNCTGWHFWGGALILEIPKQHRISRQERQSQLLRLIQPRKQTLTTGRTVSRHRGLCIPPLLWHKLCSTARCSVSMRLGVSCSRNSRRHFEPQSSTCRWLGGWPGEAHPCPHTANPEPVGHCQFQRQKAGAEMSALHRQNARPAAFLHRPTERETEQVGRTQP